MRKNIFYLIGAILLIMPMVSSAQNNNLGGSLDTAAGQAGLSQVSLPTMIGIVINAILSLLGMLFTILILLGGFRWMTSQGNRDQVADAKKTIGSAMIGLIIVVASYAIARFVFSRLSEATGNYGGSSGSGSS